MLKTEGLGKKKIEYMKHIKIQSCHMGVIFMPKVSDTSNAKMCAYSKSDLELPHWKCVMRCCAKCPSNNLPDQEIDDQY